LNIKKGYILLRFGGGVSLGLGEAFEVLSMLCLVGLFNALFRLSRFDSESLRSFFTGGPLKEN
jgi:hypothetical protein